MRAERRRVQAVRSKCSLEKRGRGDWGNSRCGNSNLQQERRNRRPHSSHHRVDSKSSEDISKTYLGRWARDDLPLQVLDCSNNGCRLDRN